MSGGKRCPADKIFPAVLDEQGCKLACTVRQICSRHMTHSLAFREGVAAYTIFLVVKDDILAAHKQLRGHRRAPLSMASR